MDQTTIKSLIQKYRTQVETLQTVIRQLEAELPEGSDDGSFSPSESTTNNKPIQTGDGSDPLAKVREWQFSNMSQVDAAEKFLEAVGYPLSISVLLEGLEKGGVKIGGKAAPERRQNLATVLGRSGKFGRAARGTWGLPHWRNITPVKRGGKDGETDAKEDNAQNEKVSA
jgi:hypothetical protein